jgi:hypothetical protein
MRVVQKPGTHGSLRWMQALVVQHRSLIECELRQVLEAGPDVAFDWRSPLAANDFAEYRDAALLERLGLSEHREALAEFWPRRGPQWDALATMSDGKVLLFEAKAHVSELRSDCKASPASREQILKSLAKAKAHFGASADADWATGCYQYANRLAHLYFLRDRGADAHLVMIYFTGDSDMRGPDSREEWEGAIKDVHRQLGLSADQSLPAVHDVFVDVQTLSVSALAS